MQTNWAFALKVANLQHIFRLNHAYILDAKDWLTIDKFAVNVIVIKANQVGDITAIVALD